MFLTLLHRALIAAAISTTAFGAEPVRPPIVLITIDTLRADHLPMWGASAIETPHLSALAERGVVFEQAVTTVPLTLPAHASLMTGTYPHFHQIRVNSGARLRKDLPTLATLLKGKGYRTAAFVSSAVLDRRNGLDQGFDYYGDRLGSDARYTGTAAERNAADVIDEVGSWLATAGNGPIFLWIHLYDPHAPYDAPGRFKNRGYKGEIEYVDSQLGRLFKTLAQRGIDKNGLFIVLSDHGEDLDEHGEPTHGFFVYDTVLKIPFILKFPEDRYAGTRVGSQVRIIDVLPTVFQILQTPTPAASKHHGTGLLSKVLGKSDRQLQAYAESLYARTHFGWGALFTLRSETWKFIESAKPELYDLKNDPGERRNIFAERKGLGNQLRARLRALRSRFKGAPAETVEIDPAHRERLLSLGYLGGAAPANVPLDPEDRADPKDKITVYSDIYRGMQAFVEEDYPLSLNHLTRARSLDGGAPLVHDYLGRAFLRLNRIPEAIDSFRAALQLKPGDYEASLNLAFAYLQGGQATEAAQGFELLAKLNPADWQSWHFLGVARAKEGNVEGSLEAFKRAVENNPRHRDSLFNLGTIYEKGGHNLRAIEIFRRLVEIAPDDARAWSSLATNYESASLSRKAEEAYESAIRTDPSYAAGYFNFGNFFARRGRWERAEQLYRKAVEADPEFAQAFRTLAVVLEQQGKAQEAGRMRQLADKLER